MDLSYLKPIFTVIHYLSISSMVWYHTILYFARDYEQSCHDAFPSRASRKYKWRLSYSYSLYLTSSFPKTRAVSPPTPRKHLRVPGINVKVQTQRCHCPNIDQSSNTLPVDSNGPSACPSCTSQAIARPRSISFRMTLIATTVGNN